MVGLTSYSGPSLITSFLRLGLYKYFSLLKLVIKPDSLLLEARRNQTSSEEHNQTSALPLFFELALVGQHDEKD